MEKMSYDPLGLWMGGRTKTEDGYILVTMTGRSPGQGTQRFEHRLVMEHFLDRGLWPDESVRHINDVKDDNRLENLLLVSQERILSFEMGPDGGVIESEWEMVLVRAGKRSPERPA